MYGTLTYILQKTEFIFHRLDEKHWGFQKVISTLEYINPLVSHCHLFYRLDVWLMFNQLPETVQVVLSKIGASQCGLVHLTSIIKQNDLSQESTVFMYLWMFHVFVSARGGKGCSPLDGSKNIIWAISPLRFPLPGRL